jgi:hypothetical protein
MLAGKEEAVKKRASIVLPSSSKYHIATLA